MMPAIASPSLNSATKARMVGAPGRVKNSCKGAATLARNRPVRPTAAARAAIMIGSGANNVAGTPNAINPATPSSAAVQPIRPDIAMTPEVAISSATR